MRHRLLHWQNGSPFFTTKGIAIAPPPNWLRSGWPTAQRLVKKRGLKGEIAMRMAMVAALGLCALSTAACIPGGGGQTVGTLPPQQQPQIGTPPPAPQPLPTPAPNMAAAPSAAPITPSARVVTEAEYVVQPGDTLRGIGNRTGAGSEEIARANGLVPPFVIRPGQHLRIPGGRYHDVAAGQTGIAIARAYGVPWSAIVAENNLGEPFILRIGQRLRLPEGAATAPLSIEQQAAAFELDIDSILTGAREAQAQSAPVVASVIAPPATQSGFAFQWPLTGRVMRRFGPVAFGQTSNGLLIAAERGAPVRAARAGRVVYAGSDISVLGGLILIDHGGGWHSAYGLLERIDVRMGDQVALHAPIGTVGRSTEDGSPRLHFELRRDRQPVDPLAQLPPLR